MYYQIYQDSNNQWRWRLRAANHETIASGEAYWSKANCLHAINLVKGSTNALVYEA